MKYREKTVCHVTFPGTDAETRILVISKANMYFVVVKTFVVEDKPGTACRHIQIDAIV